MDANANTTSINKEDEEFKKLDLLSRVSSNAEFKENYQNSYFTKTKLVKEL